MLGASASLRTHYVMWAMGGTPAGGRETYAPSEPFPLPMPGRGPPSGAVHVLSGVPHSGVLEVGRRGVDAFERADVLAQPKGCWGFAPIQPVCEITTDDTAAVEEAVRGLQESVPGRRGGNVPCA